MTISSTTVRNSYSGDGSTTTFSYTFKIFAESDLQVIIRSSTGTETTKTITTHYTVTGVGVSGGGSVIFTSGNIPSATETVVLRRNVPQTQSIDYIANDPFPAESHEEGLDRSIMVAQQIQEELGRAIKLSRTNTITSTEFTANATARANKIFSFDSSGELSITQELGTFKGNWSASTAYLVRDLIKDTSTGNIFICITAHTSSGSEPITSNADSAKWSLIVDNAAASANANAAANHASNSSNFANNSSNSSNSASNHASNASNHASNASNSASNAANSEASVSANANASANHAANASNFANNSSNSANSASNHSANASNFANNASNHASNASNHASNASNHASNASNHASNSSNYASNSSNSANNSANHASNSSNHASNSANHASNSQNHASNSSNHSANSSNFANNSSNHASNSSNHASNAANHASNAANSAAAAAASADNFDDVYLGAKASDPALDNDGDPLTAGDLYFNTSAGNLKYYTGSAWVAITSGGITDVVQDGTPQLGGNLDVNGNSIVSVSNGNINITPNGTGSVVLDGLSYPQADGSANQVLKTNGSGVLSFTTLQGGNITTEGDYFSNYNTITADVTTTVAGTVNGFLSGPITVNSGFTWTIASGSELRVL